MVIIYMAQSPIRFINDLSSALQKDTDFDDVMIEYGSFHSWFFTQN